VGALIASRRPSLRPRTFGALALGTLGALLPVAGRPLALLWVPALAGAVALLSRTTTHTVDRTLLAVLLGAAPSLVIVGAAHDLLGLSLHPSASAVLLFLVWWAVARTLGAAIAGRVEGRTASFDVWARIGASLAVTGYVGGALIRLLLPAYSTAERLTWAIWEEDNAHTIGVAREVITDGARGGRLADQYGTAFVNIPLLLIRLFGGPAAAETDPRLQAITVFTVSTIVIILLAGIAMAVVSALPHHVHEGRWPGRISPGNTAISAVAVAVATLVAFSLLVVLPMRTGFLTFVWGLTLVLLGAAFLLVTPTDAGPVVRSVLMVFLGALFALLLSSWPFIAPALAPILLAPLLWVPWRRVVAVVRRNGARSLGVASALLVGLLAVGYWFATWGPAAEVLSYGRDILLIEASGIFADETARRGSGLAILTASVLSLVLLRRSSRPTMLLGVVGPAIGAGALYLGLRVAAEMLTGGELNYSGVKLFYGIVTLAIVLGLLATISLASRFGIVGALGALLLVAYLHQSSSTASLHTEWWSRTLLGEYAHVEATLNAIRQTTPDVPIRCLPSPGTVITDTSKWAAFTCVRWMEDAFNEDRFHAHRFDLLQAEGETFESVVEEILASSPSRYLFAYRFTMGPGWFGWPGPGS
jgi:hypothetical protein